MGEFGERTLKFLLQGICSWFYLKCPLRLRTNLSLLPLKNSVKKTSVTPKTHMKTSLRNGFTPEEFLKKAFTPEEFHEICVYP